MSSKVYTPLLLLFLLVIRVSPAQQKVTVEEVVQLAIQKNFDVRVAQTTAATQFTDKRYIYGAFLPTFNLSGSYIKSQNQVQNTPFGKSESGYHSKVTNTNPSLQMSWTLFDGTKMFATKQRLEQLAEWGEVNVRNQIMNSVAATMTNYYNIVRQQEQLKAIEEVMSVNLERVKLAERKLDVGTGAKPELLQAKVDLNAQRTLAVQQEILIQQIKDQMSGQTGFGLPDGYDVADSIPIDMDITQEEVIQNIENTNQTVLAAKKNVDVATTAIWENKALRSPVIQLVSAYNFNRNENGVQYNTSIQQLTQTRGFNYGVSLSVPILNNMSTSRLISQARVTQSRMIAIYEQQRALAVVGVKNAFTNYDNSKRILKIQEENILVAKENVAIALAGFKRGITTFIELRTAQQSLSDAYNQLIAARYNAKISEIELRRLQGALLTQ